MIEPLPKEDQEKVKDLVDELACLGIPYEYTVHLFFVAAGIDPPKVGGTPLEGEELEHGLRLAELLKAESK